MGEQSAKKVARGRKIGLKTHKVNELLRLVG
jgi:hypothetical protein